MAEPIALCLEDMDATDASRRFLRCVALQDYEFNGHNADRRRQVRCATGQPGR